MQINKFSKNKNGMYTIYLDNKDKLIVHEDLILKYDLLIKKEIDNNLKETLLEENRVYEIYEVAVSYINKKLRSIKELETYLKKKEYSTDQIDSVIELLKKQGYLDEKTYANSYVHDKIALSNDGPDKIRKFLIDNNINNEIIEEAIKNYPISLEKERIEKLINKQIKTNKNKGSNYLKRKIQLDLINLGYTYELINEILNQKDLNDEELYKKEYDKLYKQLSKKYSGKELEYKLKQRLYQKGFTIN